MKAIGALALAGWAIAGLGLIPEASFAQQQKPQVTPGQASSQQQSTPGLPQDEMNRVRDALETAPKNEIDDSKMSFAPGVAAPNEVVLQKIPAKAVSVDPQISGLEYFTGRTDYFIVDPSTRKIKFIVPKNTGF